MKRKGRYPRKVMSAFDKFIQFILDKRNSKRHPESFAKAKRGLMRRQERKFVRSYCQINGDMVLNDDTWDAVQRAINAPVRNNDPYFAALEAQYGRRSHA